MESLLACHYRPFLASFDRWVILGEANVTLRNRERPRKSQAASAIQSPFHMLPDSFMALRLCSPPCGRRRLFNIPVNTGISVAFQHRHFVKPRNKIRDPLADAPSTTLSYPAVTETQNIPEGDAKVDKLTFIHRPPPTSPSPHSIITAPASPLLRPSTPHQKVFKGIVKLMPGRSPIITLNGKVPREDIPSKRREAIARLMEKHKDEPPLLREYPHEKTRHLTEKELTRMRTLREKNPQLYTRSRLAKMFGCSPVFVSMAAPLPKEKLKEVWAAQKEQRSGWTWRKQLVREMRKKRRDLW